MTSPYKSQKTVALNAEQVQQLLISTMKFCPARLRLDAFALPLQLIPVHLFLPARAHVALTRKPNPNKRFGV